MSGSTVVTATQNLAVAEVNLLAARNAADQERRDAAMKEVLRLKARLMDLKPKLEEAGVNTQVATNRRLQLHYGIVDANAQLAQWSAPLDIETFLTKQELEKRSAQVKRWQTRHDELVAEYRKVADYEGRMRREAMELDAEYKVLSYQFRNVVTIAEGGEPGFPNLKGGLTPVDADFLTIPGSPVDYPAVTVKAPGLRELLSNGSEPPDTRTSWAKLCG
jgi:chromosome segregation ATPase